MLFFGKGICKNAFILFLCSFFFLGIFSHGNISGLTPKLAFETHWTTNGKIITDTNNTLWLYPRSISDGGGGAIITWTDKRDGADNDIYAQRIDQNGNSLWEENGVLICGAINTQTFPAIVGDGKGGAIITWQDMRNDGLGDIYAQKLNSSGELQWTTDGVEISTQTSYQSVPKITSDKAGGAVIAWKDQRTGDYNLYARRISSEGSALWTLDGTPICQAVNYQEYHEIISDNTGGAIIAWEDSRTGTEDIYCQRINGTGFVKWATNGIPLCDAPGEQYDIDMVEDGTGGSYIAWDDHRSDNSIYTQHITAEGSILLGTNGKEIYSTSANLYAPSIVKDGNNGLILIWYDMRNGDDYDLFAQRIDSSGNKLWNTNGITICEAVGKQSSQRIIKTSEKGFLITWDDEREGSSEEIDIYAQAITLEGDILWGTKGKAICTAEQVQENPQIVPDNDNGAIIIWDDERQDGSHRDLYAQRIWHNPSVPENDEDNGDKTPDLAISYGSVFMIFVLIGLTSAILISLKRRFSVLS
jgi:hypothetical protein